MGRRMMKRLLFFPASLVVLSFGCARPQSPPPAASTPALTSAPVPAPPPRKHRDVGTVHRLDFVLSTKDPAGSPPPTAFSLVVEEEGSGEVIVGKNVVLSPAGARQDVGLKVKTHYRAVDDAVLINVDLEMSALDPPNIRKIVTNGSVLAQNGKSAVVVSLDEDRKHYELAVVPTKLH
jgi:hypothetical protein